jgi:hypothetical protein
LSRDRLLLRQIGVFFHGEEWQAPLARDLRVNERTIRRWVAGTEEIPRGVWRDLSAHLAIYDRTLRSLVAQAEAAAGLTRTRPLGIGDSKLNITRVALPKEKLQKLTTGERSLFLLLGYASNQIPANTESERMSRLEDLKPNASVRGILPNCLVSVVNTQWFGSEALELTYKDPTGKVGNELLYRHDEQRFKIVEEGRPWGLLSDPSRDFRPSLQ